MIGNLELLEMAIEDERHLKLCSEALQAAELASELTTRTYAVCAAGKAETGRNGSPRRLRVDHHAAQENAGRSLQDLNRLRNRG